MRVRCDERCDEGQECDEGLAITHCDTAELEAYNNEDAHSWREGMIHFWIFW